MTSHMARKDPAAPSHVCPGMRIQVIDIVHPPGIDIPPIADMDVHQAIVAPVLTANTRPRTARNAP